MNKNFNLEELENQLKNFSSLTNTFEYTSIALASPKNIQTWCQRILPTGQIVGEVLHSETINYITRVPISGGMFCQKIFGPINDWKCRCGKYKGVIQNKICEICGVELTEARVRRYRMGYVSLPAPVCHFWYFNSSPAYLYELLKLSDPHIDNNVFRKMIYYYTQNETFSNRILNKETKFFKDFNKKNIKLQGTELILNVLRKISNNLEERIDFLRNQSIKLRTNFKLLRLLESFFATDTKPEWMILTLLPVLPPTLRPLVEAENKTLVSSDLNEFYKTILNRIKRYKIIIKNVNLFADQSLVYHEKRLIQYAVDALIDNAKLPQDYILNANNRTLKSLTESLEGKFGRFRQTLLGKRVDYSARSVIVVEPDLQLNEFGLPYQIATELFKPYLINFFAKSKIKFFSKNPKITNIILGQNSLFIWKILEKLSENFSLLLNRAPTLHRFGIQAFLPIIIPTNAIQLHPLVCSGFNADFDGDQMAIHLPLYEIAQLEAKTMMRPSFNIFSPSNGETIIKPAQDIVIGCYYLSLVLKNNVFLNNLYFAREDEALGAFYQKKISLHTQIFVRYSIKNLKLKIIDKKLFIFFANALSEKITILKFLNITKSKIILFTNVGIFLAEKINNIDFQVTTFFLNTTPGRLLLNTIFKSLFN